MTEINTTPHDYVAEPEPSETSSDSLTDSTETTPTPHVSNVLEQNGVTLAKEQEPGSIVVNHLLTDASATIDGYEEKTGDVSIQGANDAVTGVAETAYTQLGDTPKTRELVADALIVGEREAPGTLHNPLEQIVTDRIIPPGEIAETVRDIAESGAVSIAEAIAHHIDDAQKTLENNPVIDNLPTDEAKNEALHAELSHIWADSPDLQQTGTNNEYASYIESKIARDGSAITEPLYHGTTARFDEFNTEPDATSGSRYKNAASFFTRNRQLAEEYAPRDENGRVMTVLVNIHNPKDYAFATRGVDLSVPRNITTEVRQRLLDQGYDAVLNMRYDGEVAIFDANKIHILGSAKDATQFKQFLETKDLYS